MRIQLAVSTVYLLGLGAAGCLSQPAPMTEWYYADGIIQPDGINPKEAREGVWSPAREWMVIFNLSPRETTATARFYLKTPRRGTFSRSYPRAHRDASSCTISRTWCR
jgi:hypothetical protein